MSVLARQWLGLGCLDRVAQLLLYSLNRAGQCRMAADAGLINYIEAFKEAKVGSAMMRETIAAITHRTNRALVSFIAE